MSGNNEISDPQGCPSHEYSLAAALHLVLDNYLRQIILCHYHICDGRPKNDELAGTGYVMVKEETKCYRIDQQTLTRELTLFTDTASNPTNIANYYFSSVKLNKKNPSDAFIIYTNCKLTDEMKKFYVVDNGPELDSSERLFNLGGHFLQVGSSIKAIEGVALAINQSVLSEILGLINKANGGKVDAELRQSMMSHCPSESCSVSAFADFVNQFLPVPNAECGIVEEAFVNCFGDYDGEDFKTLDHLDKFILKFRLARNQPTLEQLQAKTKKLFRQLGVEPENVYKSLFESLTQWYTSDVGMSKEERTWNEYLSLLERFEGVVKYKSSGRCIFGGEWIFRADREKCLEVLTALKARWVVNGKPCRLSKVRFTSDDIVFREDGSFDIVGVCFGSTSEAETFKRVMHNELMREEMGWPEENIDWCKLHQAYRR